VTAGITVSDADDFPGAADAEDDFIISGGYYLPFGILNGDGH